VSVPPWSATLLAALALSGAAAAGGELPMIGGAAPGFALTAQDGRPLALADLRGKVVVVDFVFASCADSCPLQTARLAGLQGRLGKDFGPGVVFVSISVDPERDTPAVLRHYAAQHGASESASPRASPPSAPSARSPTWSPGCAATPMPGRYSPIARPWRRPSPSSPSRPSAVSSGAASAGPSKPSAFSASRRRDHSPRRAPVPIGAFAAAQYGCAYVTGIGVGGRGGTSPGGVSQPRPGA